MSAIQLHLDNMMNYHGRKLKKRTTHLRKGWGAYRIYAFTDESLEKGEMML
jgi:hypothetical protein